MDDNDKDTDMCDVGDEDVKPEFDEGDLPSATSTSSQLAANTSNDLLSAQATSSAATARSVAPSTSNYPSFSASNAVYQALAGNSSNSSLIQINLNSLQQNPFSSAQLAFVASRVPPDPLTIYSSGNPAYKWKYPEAAPCPPGIDDDVWHKRFNAADSRLYNHNNKSATESKKRRQTGETYAKALVMMQETINDAMAKATGGDVGGGSSSVVRSAPTVSKPKAKVSAAHYDELTGPGDISGDHLSISEKIKGGEGRRKAAAASSVGTSSNRSTPAPSTATSTWVGMPTTAPAVTKPAATKKKGTASAVKKTPGNKFKPEPNAVQHPASNAKGKTPATESDSESNDGGEYCICRGPDDHRMMVFCEAGCEEWYHCECVGINEALGKELLDRFICPKCTTAELKTLYKRTCRCDNRELPISIQCRKAARVNPPDGEKPSRYCSQQCLENFNLYWWGHLLRKDDEPALGGRLSQKEVAMLVANCDGDMNEFRKLGQKPRLQRPEGYPADRPIGLDYLTTDEQKEIDEITRRMDIEDYKIDGYKNQLRLLDMVSKRHAIACEHLGKTAKEICGYDNRLAFNDYEFKVWLVTGEGHLAFTTGVLGPRTLDSRGIAVISPYDEQEVRALDANPDNLVQNMCLNVARKCRHNSWYIIHRDDFANMRKVCIAAKSELKAAFEVIVDMAETREATKAYDAHNIVEQLF